MRDGQAGLGRPHGGGAGGWRPASERGRLDASANIVVSIFFVFHYPNTTPIQQSRCRVFQNLAPPLLDGS